jgi:hypothetical protein
MAEVKTAFLFATPRMSVEQSLYCQLLPIHKFLSFYPLKIGEHNHEYHKKTHIHSPVVAADGSYGGRALHYNTP